MGAGKNFFKMGWF